MSISLVGIMVGLPVALAMRTVMGKEKFEEWIESSNYILHTNFANRLEMLHIVEEAGYDVVEWMGSLKTHLTEQKSSYFLWEQKDEKIVAKMSVYDNKEDIKKFVSQVEEVAGRKVFWEEKGGVEKEKLQKKDVNMYHMQTNEKEILQKQEYKETFPSIYVDADLVLEILQRYQIKVLSFQENLIEAEYECYKMSFFRESSDEPFDINIISSSNKTKELYNCLNTLNDEYYASMQERTYLHIREQLEEEGLEIEEEEVLEDNSIVITVLV